MADKLTNIVTANIATWTTKALAKLEGEQLKAAEAVLTDPEAQLRVVSELTRGRIVLEAVKGTQKCELYSDEVAPLRPRTGFAEPESEGGH
jgi:hypothetical protein